MLINVNNEKKEINVNYVNDLYEGIKNEITKMNEVQFVDKYYLKEKFDKIMNELNRK